MEDALRVAVHGEGELWGGEVGWGLEGCAGFDADETVWAEL